MRTEACRASGTLAGVGRANNAGNVGNANNVNGVAASTVASRRDRPCRHNQTAEHDRGTDALTRAKKTEEPLWHDILGQAPPDIARRLSEGWTFGGYRKLTIYEPKRRDINHLCSDDDISAENAVTEACIPLFGAAIPECSHGSVRGRGIHSAFRALRRVFANNPTAYYVKTDFRHYYESIGHPRLKRLVSELFAAEPGIADFYRRLIDSYPKGVPIGVSASQHLANLYLAELDHRLMSSPDVVPGGVVRYMDDIAVVTADKQGAWRVLDIIKGFAAEVGLEVKHNVRIAPVSCGIDMVGYVVYPTHTRLRKAIKLRMKSKAARLAKLGIDGKEYKTAMASYYGWCAFANARHLLRKTLGSSLKLFDMQIKRKRDLKPKRLFFGLAKDKFVSITTLDGKEVLILETMPVVIKGVPKTAVKLCLTDGLPDDPDDDAVEANARYTITASEVIRDRLDADRDIIPFAATIHRVNNRYYSYD